MTSMDSPEGASEEPDERASEAQRIVVVLSRDVFFVMRIRTTLRQLGYSVTIAPDAARFTEHLATDDTPASLGLIDFNHGVAWGELAGALGLGIPIVAFGPHKDVEGFRAAKLAGVTRVVANGEFSRSLPELVQKYALPS